MVKGLTDDVDFSRDPSTGRPGESIVSGFLLDTSIPSELNETHTGFSWGTRLGRRSGLTCFLVPERLVSVGVPLLGIPHGYAPEKNAERSFGEWFEQYLLPLFGDRILPVTQRDRRPLGCSGGWMPIERRPSQHGGWPDRSRRS